MKLKNLFPSHLCCNFLHHEDFMEQEEKIQRENTNYFCSAHAHYLPNICWYFVCNKKYVNELSVRSLDCSILYLNGVELMDFLDLGIKVVAM